MNEAAVSEDIKVFFSINSLKGSAQDWAINELKTFADFKDRFLKRYWLVEKERETFSKIKFSMYKNRAGADYFFKIIKEASFLFQPLVEEELSSLIINHFPPDIEKWLINSGYKTIEDIDKHLRRIDSIEDGDIDARPTNRDGRRNNFLYRSNRLQGQQSSNGNVNASANTIFSKNSSELLAEGNCEMTKPIAVVPTIEITAESMSVGC